ncbi:hypothetical protein CHLRE_16g677205v5 [Chlamydomonas reinhardtii]|uniref:Alpha-2-macroglobulin domain-containing protein n=1 Tax=Chlamydomonas reinhardtii TaxID=3055 RepID=A0A2K3CVU9_CHLRE|nr:uncharacterized protein CHLRE_16g677205v5 [Chlamydomonas reinhardtii]PNW72413.1 hypothetical protein CHLRE_16g677205v5 [Chlamydomonas reinhardtii]
MSWTRGDVRLRGLLLVLGTFALVGIEPVSARTVKPKYFLQKALPLNLVVTTPVELSNSDSASVGLYGRQALTAVFSRPVIALGSDFGTPASEQKLPFRLNCPVPGKARWVTTTIARFDADVDWPTDLDCELTWTAGLTSYDGAPLQLGDTPASRKLSSSPLTLSISDVLSDKADELTDGRWASSLGLPDDSYLEVPPDGRIVVQFSGKVHLATLQSYLKVAEGVQGKGAEAAFTLAPCQSPAPWIFPYTSATGTGTQGATTPLSLDVNATCVEVSPKNLKPDTVYAVRLPVGSRYFGLSGPLQSEAVAPFRSLRPFRFYFQQSSWQNVWAGTKYRRFDLGLLHGLGSAVTSAALAGRISLCARGPGGACSPVPFSLSLVYKGLARLSVDSLKPGTQHTITVAGAASIIDGYDQALQGSSLTFYTSYVDYSFVGPALSNMALLEPADVDSLASWPFVSRGPPPLNPDQPWYQPAFANRIDAWEVDISVERNRVMLLKSVVQSSFGQMNLQSIFGAPAASVAVPIELRTPGSGADWQQLSLSLAGAKVRVVSFCCNSQGGISDAKLLVRSGLSLNVVQLGDTFRAWLLESSEGGAAVAGATVYIHVLPNNGRSSVIYTSPDAVMLGTCVTGADGVCTITKNSDSDWSQVAAFALTTDGRAAVLPSAGYINPDSPPANYVASLVADRRVIVPGDSLKVTGFVQQVSATGLKLPAESWVVVEVSPNWQASASGASGGTTTGGGGVISPGRGLMDGAVAAAVAADTVSAVGPFSTEAALPVATIAAELPVAGRTGRGLRGSTSSSSAGASAVAVGVSTPMTGAKPTGGVSAGGSTGTTGNALTGVPTRYFAKIDGASGVLHVEVPIPAYARLQPYTLQLRLPKAGTALASGARPDDATAAGWSDVAGSLGFTVADPRPPTAELKVDVPPWVLPTAAVALKLTAVSYVGAPVDNSPITVTWSHSKASGVIKLTTGLDGVASTTLDLGALPEINRTTAYDTLSIAAEWVGPTRELIQKSATIILADGPARLQLQTSLDTDVPGVAFALGAQLTSNVDGSAITGLAVTATLKPDTSAGPAACADTPSCATTSGAGLDAGCQLALPCVGRFVLEACATTASGPVCANQTLGRNTTEWSLDPLDSFPAPNFLTDKASYKIGESATVRFQNPWAGARLMLTWGNNYASKHEVVASLPAGLASHTFGPLGNECLGGCSVSFVLDVPRLSASALPLPPPEQLKVSKLYDPRAPATYSQQLSLTVLPENELAVTVAVAAAPGVTAGSITDADGKQLLSIEPGSEATVTVTVGSVGAGASVTVYGVDKAFLDLLPYPLPAPQQEVVLRLAAAVAAYGPSAYRLAPGAVQAVFAKLMSRLTGLDPWLPADTTVRPGDTGAYFRTPYYSPSATASAAAVDMEDAAYLALYTSPLTYLASTYIGRYGGCGITCMDSAASNGGGTNVVSAPSVRPLPGQGAATDDQSKGVTAPESGGSSGSGGSSSKTDSSVTVRQEADFIVTPLFTTAVTDASGVARVAFTAPPNLGTFVLRAFAASGAAAKYGSGEAKLAVRRALSLTPSVPRFVRVGDQFEAGVVVTVGSAPASVTVSLKLENAADSPLTLNGVTSKTVTIAAGGGLQQEVRFSFTAVAIASATLVFDAVDSAAGGGSDSLSLEVPVYGQQGDVWVATSFALKALPASDSDVVQWQEGLALPDAVPGSGGLALTAGVGYWPSIAATYDNLAQRQDDYSGYAYAQPSMLWAVQPPLLQRYGQPASAAGPEALLHTAYTNLGRLTLSNVGLVYSDPSRWYSWTPTRTDMYLNSWALFLAAEHAASGKALSGDLAAAYATDWSGLAGNLVPLWRAAVERQLIQDARDARMYSNNKNAYEDWYTLAWVRLAMGPDWNPPAWLESPINNDLSLATLLNAVSAKKAGRETRVLLSLYLQALGSAAPSSPLVANTVAEVTSALRTQGRTAYVATGPGAASAASLDEQALALLLLLRSGATHQLIPKLAAYVANPSQAGGSVGWFSMYPSEAAQGLAGVALAAYDEARGSTKPDVELFADVNGLTVLEATFRTGANAPVSNTTAWEDLPSPPTGSPSELNFEVTGTGEVSVAASLHFVPSALLSFPSYRGLYVEAALQQVDPRTGGPTGGRLAAVPLGSVVALTVQLTTPDDLGAVTLSVMMPGGLEPLDPNLVAGADSACTDSWVDGSSWGYVYRWYYWFPICPAQETRPSVVTFNYLSLRAGTSSVVIKAVAATAGTFVVPPIRAWVDEQPELMGSTAGAKISVCADCAGPTYGALPPPPKPCPADCSGNGVCNLKTGKCVCNAYWTRADCSRMVPA